MKRQHLKLVALACSAVFGLAACGSSGGSNDSAPNFSGADAGGAIFGNGFAKNNNGSNGNGNNNAGNNTNNCGFFGCSPSNPGNNGGNNNGGGNNGGGNNGGNANNNNGGNNNARPAPNFVHNGFGVYYAETNYHPNLNHGSKANPTQLTAVKSTRDLNTLDVDGFLFNVDNAAGTDLLSTKTYFNNDSATDAAGLTTNGSKQNFRYSRFGSIFRSQGPFESDFIHSHYYFSVGDVTPESSMPTSGTAHYSGFSSDSSLVQRLAKFDVDFGAKTVDGTISGLLDPRDNSDGGVVSFRLHGNINGSSFSGARHQIENTTDSDAVMNMKGKFYGPEAQEMGGVYYGNDGNSHTGPISGAFGAKRN